MKGSAQVQRVSAAAHVLKPPAAVQPLSRSNAGSRLRARAKDRLEQEADDTAARFLRGETGLARHLSRTEAAAVPTSESHGTPLPKALLESLQRGFGADLSLVRLHRGPQASHAADALAATAFAAGPDIFFSRHAPSLESEPGRRLLAHEIAHTIQQAGRNAAGNRISVVSTHGRRRPQLTYKSPLESTPEAEQPTFDQLSELYLTTFAKKPKLVALVGKLRKQRDAAIKNNDESSFWDALAKQTTETKDFDPADREIRSFVFDCLKLGGRIPAAIHLLTQDIFLFSAFFVKEVYEQMPPAAGYAWLGTVWLEASVFTSKSKTDPRDFSPKRWVDSIYQFLLGASRDVPDLSPTTPFATIADEALKKRESPSGLIGNELLLVTLWTVKEVDRIRQRKLAEIAHKVGPELEPKKKGSWAQWLSPNQRKQVAKRLVVWADTLEGASPEIDSAAEEVLHLYRQLAKSIRATAGDAVQFWEGVERFDLALRSGNVVLGSLGTPMALVKKFAAQSEFQQFRAALGKSARRQLALQKPDTANADPQEQTIFPSPSDYETSRNDFIRSMRKELWERFEKRLLAEAKKAPAPAGKAPTSKQLNPLLATVYGWMAAALYQLFGILEEYDPAADKAYSSNPTTTNRADIRIEHRDKLARWLWMFGVHVGWEEFLELGNAVVSASQAGQKQSQVAIFGNWKDDGASISRLTRDFGSGKTVGNWAPLTFGDLVNFYQTQRMQDITTELAALMNQPNAFDPLQDAVVSRAIRTSDEKAAKARLYPRRFSIERFVAQLRPEDIKGGNFADFIWAHPKTQALFATEKPPGAESVAPQRPGQGVFLWIIPSLLPVIKILRSIDEFHAIIFRARVKDLEPTAEDLATIRAMDPLTWFTELGEAIKAANSKQFQAARAKLSEHLSTGFKTAQTQLEKNMHVASVREREMRVTRILEPALREYDRYDQYTPSTTMGGVVFEIPGKVLMQIGSIASAMAPVNEQNWHYAALFLQLAPLLHSQLGNNPRGDVANDYYPAINVALSLVADSRPGVLSTMPGKDDAWINARVAELNSLQPILQGKLLAGQMAFGLIGHVEGSRQFVSGVSEGEVIEAEKNGKRDPFTIDGVTWAIVHVHRNFQFNPKYGALPSVLAIEEKEIPVEKRTEALVLVTVNIEGRMVKITAAEKDEELLGKLSYAVTMTQIIRQLNQLVVMMETIAELTLDALEFIPGAGQAIMAARLAVAIMTFVASGEAQTYIDALTKDPLGEIKRILTLIGTLFTPDELWHWVLLGNNKFDQLHAKTATPKLPANKAPKGAFKKFLRVMARLWNLGEGILGSLGRMQSHVRWEVEAVQMSVLRHPLLAGALRWIANHLEQIAQISLMALAAGEKLVDKPDKKSAPPEESETDLRLRFNEAVDKLPDNINRAALQLGELQFPAKVLPLEEVIDVIVQIILERLGAKYRVLGAVILKLLDISGKRAAVFGAIADLIPEALDPNTYWKTSVVDPLSPKLNDAKNALIDSFYDRLLDFDLFEPKKGVLASGRSAAKSKTIGVQTGELPEPEVQPHGAVPRSLAGPVGPVPAAGPPLDPSIRRSAEQRFGHDFGHVRLATGPAAGRFTGRFGADALTSGSQVFLRPGLSPTTGKGARILDHEFTHVLQQTGPRPLGQPHPPRPVPGAPGRGLMINPVSERVADRVAGALRQRPQSTPVSVAPGRKGWQPALPYNVIRGLLDDITSTGDIERDEAKVDLTGETAGLKKLPAKQKQRINNFAEHLKQAIQAAKDFASPFNDPAIVEAIKRQIISAGPAGENNFTAIANALGDLAADSLRERRAKDGEVKSDEPQVVAHIDPRRFGVLLGRYIFGRTGILAEIELLPANHSDEDTAITVSKIKVLYVHLPPVNAQHELWTKAVAGLIGKNPKELELLADKKRLYRRLRLYLESKGPAPGIWKPKSYGLQQRVLSSLVEFVEAMAAGEADLTPDDLPRKKEYLDPKGTPGPLGHIGLRLGTYKDSNNQQGRDRESHHTTQFLLLEYFAQKNDTQRTADSKPFPLIATADDIYPGLAASGGAPQTFHGATKMDLAGLVKGRGDAMPAILLARPTHRTGNLHVTTKADDFNDKTDSPAGVVSFVFHEKLGGDKSPYRTAEKAGATAFKAFTAGREAEVKTQIYTAMQDTYKWMRDFMRERLDNALPALELKYYNQLAEDGGSKDRITPREMLFVAAAAKENNLAEMARWGWER